MKLGECLISEDLALSDNLREGMFLFLKFNINRELYILYDHYKVREGDTTGYYPQMGTVVAPCKISGTFSGSGGKIPNSEADSSIFMEYESFYDWISPYVQPNDTNPSMVAFRNFLLGQYARPYDLADYVIMLFPDPRIDYYKESDYDDVQKNVVSYVNVLVNDLGFFPEAISCDILEELQQLSLGLVFLGIIFSVISVLFIIISILLIYSLLMVTVEEKSFEIGIYRMVGLNK